MRRGINRLVSVAAFSTLACARLSFGQSADDSTPPTAFAFVTCPSIATLDQAMTDLGVTPPGFLTPAGLEATFDFIGAGGVDPTAPGGLYFTFKPGYDISGGDGIVFSIPVKSGAATVQQLVQHGATPGPGPDCVQFGPALMRRTAANLLFGKTTSAVKSVDAARMNQPVASLKSGEDVAQVCLDFSALRGIGIDPYQTFMTKFVPPIAAPADAAEKLGQDTVLDITRQLLGVDQLCFAFSQNDRSDNIKLIGGPAQAPHCYAGEKPGLPPVGVRLDVGVAPSSMWGKADEFADKFNKAISALPNTKVTPGDLTDLLALEHVVTRLLLSGQAMSIGADFDAPGPCIYMVQRQTEMPDVPARLQELADAYNRVAHVLFAGGALATSQAKVSPGVTLAGTAYEMTIEQGGSVNFRLSVLAKEGSVYMIGSAQNSKDLAELTRRLPEGNYSSVCTATVDLNRFALGIKATAGTLLSAAQAKAVAAIFEDSNVTNADRVLVSDLGQDGKNLVLEIALTRTMAKRLVGLLLPVQPAN